MYSIYHSVCLFHFVTIEEQSVSGTSSISEDTNTSSCITDAKIEEALNEGEDALNEGEEVLNEGEEADDGEGDEDGDIGNLRSIRTCIVL